MSFLRNVFAILKVFLRPICMFCFEKSSNSLKDFYPIGLVHVVS